MDRELFHNILDEIYERDALIVKPATEEELLRLVKDLKEEGIPEIPAEYMEFLLNIADGVAWNGFEFFGVFNVTVKKSGYTLAGILPINLRKRQRAADWLKNKLILGRFDEDLYVYDAKTKKYMALDDLTGIEVETYDSFEDLFSMTISEYLDYDEEESLYDDMADATPDEGDGADGEGGDSDDAD